MTADASALITPLTPPAKPVGNERTIDLREVINGITYILGTGCQWQALANLPAFMGCTIISICGVMTARSMTIFLPAPWLLNGNENRGIANWCSPAPSSRRALLEQCD